MKLNNRGPVLLVAVASTLMAACGPGTILESGTDIRGKITAMIPSTGDANLGYARIEGSREKDTQYDKADVALTTATRISIRRGDVLQPVPFDSVKTGQRVEAKFTGPVMESYPVRATASELVILE